MKIQNLFMWILFVLTLVTVFWYIFGNSPTLEQGLLILILTLLFTSYGTVQEIKTKLNNIEKSFQALAHDFKEHIKHK